MKFIKQEVFLNHRGQAQTMDDDTGRKAWNGEILALIADKYKPQEGLLLETVGEIRKLQRGINVLEEKPVDGFYILDDEDYDLIKVVVLFMVLRMPLLVMSAPSIEDIFEGVTSRLPKEMDKKPSKNGKVEAETLEEAETQVEVK